MQHHWCRAAVQRHHFHRAHVTNDYLEAEGIEQMKCPACPPDLNPIDYMWSRHSHARHVLHASVTRPHAFDGIEVWRACWTFHLFDTLTCEVVVGHVNTLRTHVDVLEDKPSAAVSLQKTLQQLEYLLMYRCALKFPCCTPR